MQTFLRQVLNVWFRFGAGRGVNKRRKRIDEYEVLKNLGREQLESLKRKGLSIPVLVA